MARVTGKYRVSTVGGEKVQAFVPHALPPRRPPLLLDESLNGQLNQAMAAIGQLSVAAKMVPSVDWFLYGFVRKEAVISSQIEGTQATLQDVLAFEATHQSDQPEDVQEVCNYVEALTYARRQIASSKGLPLSTRLLCQVHKRLMKGVRGAEKQPGQLRRSQNWIGGTRPGNAAFVPPPPDAVPEAMAILERWIHNSDPLPPLVRAALTHVQFETIHPFLDGNGRIGRLLVSLLLEQWGLLSSPLLYLSLAFKRNRSEYYRRLSAVRTDGDWEGWTAFFLECVNEAASDGVDVAQRLFATIGKDRQSVFDHPSVTVSAIRLFDQLPDHPVVTLPGVIELLKTTKPTASKAIKTLQAAGVLRETTGKQRNRVYAYHNYLHILTRDTERLTS